MPQLDLLSVILGAVIVLVAFLVFSRYGGGR